MSVHRTKSVSGMLISLILALVMIVGQIPLAKHVQAAGPNATDVTIYGLDDRYKSKISIPKDKPLQFQIEIPGQEITGCYVSEGESCDVTTSGLITPHFDTYIIDENGTIEYRLHPGKSVVKCFCGADCYEINVDVINYAEEYVSQRIQNYLDTNVYSGMNDKELLDVIAKYPASFDYDYNYSSYIAMVIFGGGDCWASTALICKECQLLGIDAWTRSGSKDTGAGRGHINAIVELHNKYYQVEAGYEGAAPRYYEIIERETLFCWSETTDGDGVIVTQYDGKYDKPFCLEVPDQIEGLPVIGIDEDFVHHEKITGVALPDTIRFIGERAFAHCINMESIKIPAAVEEIGEAAFLRNPKLAIDVATDNPNYCSISGSLYTKDKTKLVVSPSCKSIDFPDSLKELGAYAFYGNENITSLIVPESVEVIGNSAFEDASSLKWIVLKEGSLTTLGDYLFRTVAAKEVTIPASVTSISARTFYGANIFTIHMKAMKAPVLPDDFELCEIDSLVFYVPEGSTGYDQGKWRELDVRVELENPSFEDFVERLYTVALGRASDPVGKEFWVKQVVEKGATGADCASFFLLDAPEFLNRGLSDDEFIEILYKTFFDRESEPQGKDFYMKYIKNHGRRNVIWCFIDSTEWCNVCAAYGIKSGAPYQKATEPSKSAKAFATRLYTCCLGRDPEPEGLEYWSLALTNLEKTGAEAAQLFFESQELVDLRLDDKEYITRLYTTFMDRQPEDGGMQYWLGEMAKGKTRRAVMAWFAQSPEFTEICQKYGIDRGSIA